MFYVYVLFSKKDGKLYFGQTQNVTKRLNLHNSGKVIATKGRKPFILLGYKSFKTRNEARWFEYEIKHHSDKKKKFLKEINVAKQWKPSSE